MRITILFFSVLLWNSSLAADAETHHAPDAKFTVTEVADGIYMLQGKGGSVAVSMGRDDMLVGTTGYVQGLRAQDMSLEQIQAKGLPSQWDPWTRGFIDSKSWMQFIYGSLEGG